MELSDGMDIAAYSTANAQTSLMQAVGTTVLKKTMDMVEAEGAQLAQMMELSVNPNVGANIDIRI